MPSPDESEIASDPEILAARGKVELAKAELESRIYQAGDTGKRALERMAMKAKPAVVVAGAVLGAVVVWKLVRRARRRNRWHLPAPDSAAPSLFRLAVGAALRGALRVFAARVAERAAARFVEANEEREPDDSVPAPS